MEIKILYDNRTKDNFNAGWGFSCLINSNILFDTGESADPLLRNLKKMDIKVNDIESIIISHDHWDHTGGLWKMLEQKPDRKVYACPHFSHIFKNKVIHFKADLIEVDKFKQISRNIYLTGEIEGMYKLSTIAEQALVIKTKKGLTVITGCAHPGIINIVEHVKRNLTDDIHLVMGGFHLMNNSQDEVIDIIEKFRQYNITFVGPCHCTGEEAITLFKKEYKDHFIDIRAGEIIQV
ncbi:MAG: MBL fold metallo-hydrolase [Spirochaetes bacterium]|nr:MBL fold metallo-hydrolase [Spirochaetota bacterium]